MGEVINMSVRRKLLETKHEGKLEISHTIQFSDGSEATVNTYEGAGIEHVNDRMAILALSLIRLLPIRKQLACMEALCQVIEGYVD
jgi:hypothetical protein